MLNTAVVFACAALTQPPAGLNEFSRTSGRSGALSSIRRATAAAVGRALADGKELLEVEFPPLLEKKTQFDDFSNVEVLDANRDFSVQLALETEIRSAAADAALWLCFADEGEAQLAREAWPGALYGTATQTYISAAVKACGREPLMPMGSSALSAASVLGKFFGNDPSPSPPAVPPTPASLQLIVQPGDGGPMEDWLNLELLRTEGTPMVCLNGALDKVTSGYYSNFLNPKLGECAERFFSKFEQVYYLKPIGSGRGWLFRVYGEPWQLFRQTKDELELVEAYDERPSPQACVDRLKAP
mmetsp:Transcript_44814/g.117555  ORF Transcript_44814/g.117555 Transcript_44814/m.117555 type:complete len:300 (+) Transcript_44814:3-902(+)